MEHWQQHKASCKVPAAATAIEVNPVHTEGSQEDAKPLPAHLLSSDLYVVLGVNRDAEVICYITQW